jgi:hypothetical protein
VKRKIAKLSLSRETIRTLTNPEMGQARGAINDSNNDTCSNCIPPSLLTGCLSYCGTCQGCVTQKLCK